MPDLKTTIDETLRNFDLLPDCAIVRRPVLCQLFSCSPSSISRLAAQGKLPRPVRIGDTITGYRVGEIRKVLEGKPGVGPALGKHHKPDADAAA